MKVNVHQNIKIVVLVLSILFSLQKSYSQNNDFWSNVSFGGNLGIGVGNDTFSGVIEPSALYNFNEQFAAGIGISFGYIESNNFTATNYGGSLLAFYSPIREIRLSLEFQEMGVSRTLEIENTVDLKEEYWYPSLFIGAGYRIGNVSVGIRYDLLYDMDKSIYGNAYVPFVGVFF
ncbi:alpha-ketoglutarate decarboxylase [Aquimarina sp. Aq78]|uniref:alpha-ketoglutarate decarboxylase n=1 Tax=Aquimarina sp. Aq78 TaxID=1191889 RepID=UPI000D0E931F|nr:alpha-ketoglutarate decarboxylase [Aquimarina sp. Aq78]